MMQKCFTSNKNNPIPLLASQKKDYRHGYTSTEFFILAMHLMLIKNISRQSTLSYFICHDMLVQGATCLHSSGQRVALAACSSVTQGVKWYVE